MYKLAVMMLAAVTLTGCFQTKTLDPNAYNYDEVQNVLSIKRGVVIAVEQANVHIEGSDDYAAVGAIAGGLAGSQLGQGVGRDVGVAVGAIAGGIAGKMSTAEQVQAFVYTIEMQKGGIIQVAQQGNYIPQGSKVFVKYYAGNRKTVSVDQSQGVTFSTTKETSYAEKDAAAAAQAKEDAARAAAEARRQRAIAQQRAAEKAKQDQREQEQYELDLKLRQLDVQDRSLDIERKTKRVNREDDFINKELDD